MKLSYLDEDNIIIYIYNKLFDIDFKNINETKNYFKKIFSKIKDKYNININGFYLVKVYKDNNYGIVIELEREETSFDEYYMDEVDMHIIYEENNFLYKIDDVFINNINEKIIIFNKNFYLRVNKNNNGYYEEIGKLIYKDTNDILKYGKLINFF